MAALHGEHGDLEADSQGRPWSVNNIVKGHRVAQEAIVAIGSRGYITSIVKGSSIERWALDGWAALGVRGHKSARWHRAKVQPALVQSVPDSGCENKT